MALLPFRPGQCGLLGEVYELGDFKTPSNDVVAQLQAILDEAFGRSGGATVES